MCFSEDVSWATFVASLAGSAVLIADPRPHVKVLGWFFVNIGLMQFFEAMLWRQRGQCTRANELLSKAAAVTNHIEPLVLWALSVRLLTPTSASAASLALVLVLAYAAIMGHATLSYLRSPRDRTCATVTRNGLVWTWNYGWHQSMYYLFVVTLMATLFAYFPSSVRVGLMAIFGGSFALSHALYGPSKMVGSMWCFVGALVPWGLVFAL